MEGQFHVILAPVACMRKIKVPDGEGCLGRGASGSRERFFMGHGVLVFRRSQKQESHPVNLGKRKSETGKIQQKNHQVTTRFLIGDVISSPKSSRMPGVKVKVAFCCLS